MPDTRNPGGRPDEPCPPFAIQAFPQAVPMSVPRRAHAPIVSRFRALGWRVCWRANVTQSVHIITLRVGQREKRSIYDRSGALSPRRGTCCEAHRLLGQGDGQATAGVWAAVAQAHAVLALAAATAVGSSGADNRAWIDAAGTRFGSGRGDR
jgi:hypothetical protein